MPKPDNGRLYYPERVAAYLGVTVARAKSLMVSQEIVSVYLEGEKSPVTIEESIEYYIKSMFYPRMKKKLK